MSSYVSESPGCFSRSSAGKLKLASVWRLLPLLALITSSAVAVDVDVDTTITNLVNNGGVTYQFGVSAPGHALSIVAGGILTNVSNGAIGVNVAASNNSVLVSDAGSGWFNNGTLTIGNSGPSNCLTIASGAVVTNSNNGTIGVGGGRNRVIVTGAGAVWVPRSVVVGGASAGNSLIISSGGTVSNIGICSVGDGGSASNNVATVTGTGSLWSVSNTLKIGHNNGPGNSVVVTNGGRLVTASGWIGRLSSGTKVNQNNAMTITGHGSEWVSGSVSIAVDGATGTNNALNIYSGGRLDCSGAVSVGSSNSVLRVGNGVGVSTALVASVVLRSEDTRLRFDGGLLAAKTDGALVSGPGIIVNDGPAYVSSDYACSIDSIISGGGDLTKLGSGTLSLTAGNTYRGETRVEKGTLALSQMWLSDSGTVRVAAGATLRLDFSGTDKVGHLFLAGADMPIGIYGAGTHYGAVLSGSGRLEVSLGPPTSGCIWILR